MSYTCFINIPYYRPVNMSARSRRRASRLHPKEVEKGSQDVEDDSSDEDVEDLAIDIGERLQEIMSSSNPNIEDDDSSEDQEHDSEDDSHPATYLIDKSSGETDTGSLSQMYTKQTTDEEEQSDSDESESDDDDTPHDDGNIKLNKKKDSMALSSSLQPAMDADKMIYLNTDIYGKPELQNKTITELMLNPKGKGSELLKQSVLTTDLEKKTEIKPYEESLNQLKKQRRLEREKTKGGDWFDMRAQEMTEEKKNDLMVIQMRRALDPKQFYKAPDRKVLPKYFQMGTVIEAPADFYNSRVPKKQRKQTLVDELLADAEFRRYNKRKYSEIQEAKMKKSRGAFKHQKRMKKRKK